MKLNVQLSTIIRTICLIIVLINQILVSRGLSPIPIDDEQITEIISTIFTTVVAVWTWWKNNSFTQSALKADEFKKSLKK